MSAELVKCAVVANRDVPNCVPNQYQDCRDEVHVAIFFDGTGNNKDADAKEKRWSNIAHLFVAASRATQEGEAGRNIYAIYISGVGTKFNGEAANWLDESQIWVEDNIGGGGAGAGGDRRMNYGVDLVNDYLRRAMIANAQGLGGTVSKYAKENASKGFGDLNFVLSKLRLIKSINISVFGFSRGAALARAFTNRLLKKCKQKEGGILYEGYPLRINFMGLFDTVASFGIPSQNARTPFAERELMVSPKVERCVHYVAAHELRFSFPLDLIRKDGKLPENWVEKVFPGVHSDVGGGYTPTEQGVSNNFSRIPLREMLKESLLSGVRILGYDDLERLHGQFFIERIECKKTTMEAYGRYMTAYTAIGGAVEQQIVAHMKLYYSAYGTMYRKGVITTRDRIVISSKVKLFLGPRGMGAEVSTWRSLLGNAARVRIGGPTAKSFAQYLDLREWQLAAWDAKASDGVVDFISRYVHDSKVDFLLNAEPFSYFRLRGVEESSISVWQEGGEWLGSKGRMVGDVVQHGMEKGKTQMLAIGDATSKAAKEAVGAVQRMSGQAVDFASSTAKKSAQAASRAYAAAANTGNQVITTGQEKISELEKNVERVYEGGTNWIRQKVE